ncbi:MAG: DUF2442 domain-containing protein [Alphaproteobacteria bacterium]|nr:DUF2442 domain-containing protein [Alphaproteobacteria bacterium]
MSISAINRDARVDNVRITGDNLEVMLRDGRRISAPLTWFPRLMSATEADRAVWELCAGGYGIHWPRIDEDLSVDGLLTGAPG